MMNKHRTRELVSDVDETAQYLIEHSWKQNLRWHQRHIANIDILNYWLDQGYCATEDDRDRAIDTILNLKAQLRGAL